MNHETLGNTIRSRFKTQIADILSLPTQYDNQSYTKPANVLWCRLTILTGESFQASFGGAGGKRFRTPGTMVAQLFNPVGLGDKAALAAADSIVAAFRAVTDTGVVFRTPSVQRIGRTESEWQINVTCPFYVDDIG